MNNEHRAHTPITSEQQAKFFGSELGRKRAGEATETDMSETELVRHLREWGRKNNEAYPEPKLKDEKYQLGNALYGSKK